MDAPLRVLVIVYPEHETAVRAYDEVRRLDQEGKIKVQDAAVVTAHDDGQLEVVSTHRHAVKSAGKAAFWGLLIGGALALPVVGLVMAGGAVGLGAHKSDRGKEDAFADRVRSLLQPGKTALFVTGTTGTATPDELIAVLTPFGGELAQSSILSETEAMFRHALRDQAKAAEAEAGAAAGTTAGEAAPPDDAPSA
jgi:uncharacterized membrane protein